MLLRDNALYYSRGLYSDLSAEQLEAYKYSYVTINRDTFFRYVKLDYFKEYIRRNQIEDYNLKFGSAYLIGGVKCVTILVGATTHVFY